MMKKTVLIIALLMSVLSCKRTKSNHLENDTVDYLETIEKEFSGDLAYQTTAFIEQFWRVAGNSGFDASVYRIAEELQKAGYVNEDNSRPSDLFTYRIEKRPLKRPTWEPVNAEVSINDEATPLLRYSTNRNMIAKHSFSTPKEGISGEVIHLKDLSNLKDMDVNGKIVFAEVGPYALFRNDIIEKGALGVITYNNPKYLKPEVNATSIQFRSIPMDEKNKPWGIVLSYAAKERLIDRLAKGKVHLNVTIETKVYASEELTIVAEIKGTKHAKERLVFSAHIQEPGANDNATGVGVALEMAKTSAKLIKENKIAHDRTLTFLWGDEIISTKRYVEEDSIRTKDIKWGISLDMVGENTPITGGTFLIEKMPDPSAIWTRGKDKHTEWGGQVMKLEQMKPHYLNDFLFSIFKAQGKRANWEVTVNPFEGGSDHVPFLRADIPSVLFWHFTDQFYHTDNDRLDKVSQTTLKNVGIAALASAFTLINSDEITARTVIKDIEASALIRLNEELRQGKLAIEKGESKEIQIEIIKAWEDWCVRALATTSDMVSDSSQIADDVKRAQEGILSRSSEIIPELKEH
jgi:hypothetical protein